MLGLTDNCSYDKLEKHLNLENGENTLAILLLLLYLVICFQTAINPIPQIIPVRIPVINPIFTSDHFNPISLITLTPQLSEEGKKIPTPQTEKLTETPKKEDKVNNKVFKNQKVVLKQANPTSRKYLGMHQN